MMFGRRAMAVAALTVVMQVTVCHVGMGVAQTFSSGSTGADGPFNPPTSVPPGTTISGSTVTVPLPPSGVFNFQTVTVGSGITVKFAKNTTNTPVTILTTGDITIAGTINLNGSDGQPRQQSATAISVGGEGGPGGYRGGNGSKLDFTVLAAAGQGPGGGAGAPATLNANGSVGTYGTAGGFQGLPLVGGSGGGGGATSTASGVPTFSGGGGGGGGGAVVLASSTRIIVTGAVTADGGFGLSCGSGSGGAIRVVAPSITGTGSLSAITPTCTLPQIASGRVRLEAFTNTFSGTSTPGPSVVPAPGPVTAASNPALINLPTLTISAVGGVSTPASTTGSYAAADIALPSGTTNPVPVTVTAVNVPLSTAVTVKVVPVAGVASTFSVSALSGTLAQSTGLADVTFPTGGIVSVVQASASVTLIAGLFPLIDGEPVERVLMAAGVGEASLLTLVTASGKTVPLTQLSSRDQQQVALAFEAMRAEAQ